LECTSVCLDNGLKLSIYNVLSGAKDFSFNNKSGLLLSSLRSNSEIFESSDVISKLNFSNMDSPITTSNNFVISTSSNNLHFTNKTVADIPDTLTFLKVSDYLHIKNNRNFYLTHNPTDDTLSFIPKIISDSNLQKFDYNLNDNLLYLYPYGYNRSKIVVSTNPLSVSSYNYNTFSSNSSLYILKMYAFTDALNNYGLLETSVVTYENNPITSTESLKRIDDLEYKQNYLVIFPYEYKTDNGYPLYINGLKNYQTPEYAYSKGSETYLNNSSTRRDYDKIFTGSNQYGGNDNVFLGYRGKTSEQIFDPNKNTKFFYPFNAPRIYIGDSGLIEDGAKSGEIPFDSDKVFVNNIDYSEFLATSSTIKKFDGTWACSWLSGNHLGDSIWMDRFYNSAYYTLDQAISAGNVVYNPKHRNISTNMWDDISTMYFEPGIRYSYMRIGQYDVDDYIKSFDFDPSMELGGKILHIKKWNSDPLLDETPYKHDGLVFYNNFDNFKGDYWVMDGENHAVFSSDNILLNDTEFTTSLWVNVDDWSDIQGEQIFGNYYNGGYGFVNSSAYPSPLFTIVENTAGKISTYNYRMLEIDEVMFEPLDDQENRIIQKLPNFDYWVFDCINLIGRRYDIEGKLLDVIPTSDISPTLSTITQVKIDSAQSLYLYDKDNHNILVLDSDGNYTNTRSITGNSFQIDLNDNLIDCYGSFADIDSSNNLWEIVGGNLYKNKQIYGNVGLVQEILFDALDNLWILHGQDTVSKLNTSIDAFTFSLRIGTRSSLPEDPCVLASIPDKFRTIDFLKVPNGKISEDLAVIVDNFDNEIYIINQNGDMLSKMNLRDGKDSGDFKYYAEGDFTGYQYLRKYGYSDKSLAWKFKISKLDGTDNRNITLKHTAKNLYKGWHMFTFAFDTLKGEASYYIDSILVDSVKFDKYIYKLAFSYRSPLLLGANTVKNKILNDVIRINNSYKFIGKVSDLRIYSKALTSNQIRALYFTFPYSVKPIPLHWNMPTGERNFIECVDKWYKMQLTGLKSRHFNINIHNMEVDNSLKLIIEESLKNVVKKIIPSYSGLNKIEWV